MIPAAQIIKQFLLDQGIVVAAGSDADWECFVGFMPDTPYQAVCCYDTAGVPDGRIMESGERIEHPGIQIQVRGGNYPAVFVKVGAIAASLDAIAGATVTVSGTDYTLQNVSRTGTIMPMGVIGEGTKRVHYFSINATVTARES